MAEGIYQCAIRDRMTKTIVYTGRKYNCYGLAHGIAETALIKKFGKKNDRFEIIDIDN
jgi:hypothetical protein